MTPEADVALRSPLTRPAILFYLDHPLGPKRFWNGIGSITWAGNTFNGAATVLGISSIEQVTEIQAVRVTFTFTLPDISDDTLAIITTPFKRRQIKLWRALLDDKGQVIPIPSVVFIGYADTPKLVESGNTRTVEIPADAAISNLTVPPHTQVSNEEQVAKYPGDVGLSMMAGIANQQLVWNVGPYNNFSPT